MNDTPYRPSSGTEGADFEDANCYDCGHYAIGQFGETYDCDLGILAVTFVFPIDAPEYPREWVLRDGKPICTAREEES